MIQSSNFEFLYMKFQKNIERNITIYFYFTKVIVSKNRIFQRVVYSNQSFVVIDDILPMNRTRDIEKCGYGAPGKIVIFKTQHSLRYI